MRKMDPSQIISFIKDEHPQIIAIVLAYLPSDLASNVLASAEEVQGTVAERIGMMGGSIRMQYGWWKAFCSAKCPTSS